MLLITAHAFGWPVAKGGSQAIAAALADRFCSLGGTVQTGVRVRSARDLPRARVVVFDTSPRALAEIAGEALPAEFASKLAAYRHGPAAFKVDFALSGAIPWTAPLCRRAGTVHVGGELEEIVASEAAAWSGKIAPRPFVLVAQQSLFDPTRAPASSHTAWAYCHVPNASEADASHAIESQIERFAPGFRSLVLARHITRPKDFAAYNANYVGGDITGGVQDWSQLFARPTLRLCPYSTPNRRIYLCSASTPPGGGVHGMCGYHAARAAMNRSAGLPHGRL